MSQIFQLQIATETLVEDAQLLGVTPEQLHHINISVSASIVQQPEPQLWLTYHIQLPYADLAAQLSWPTWQQAQVNFTDYLWEDTCLECFIGGNDTDINKSTGYIEINASPNGRYALYQFEDYRHPAILPPTPLLNKNTQTPADIHWSNKQSQPSMRPITKLSPTCPLVLIGTTLSKLTFIPCYYYQRRFAVPLNQLPFYLFDKHASDSSGIKQLHPCVILWFGGVALYFAPAHASPPDFHQHFYWTAFDYQANSL